MAPYTGALTIADLIAATHTSAAEFGLDNIAQILQADLDAHNMLVADMMADLIDETQDRQRIYGASQAGEMVEADEFTRGPGQQTKPGSTVGFPLKLFQYAIGWTRKFQERATPADYAKAQLAAQKAHLQRIQTEVKYAIFRSSNYNWTDFLVDNVVLPVKRFVNADSAPIPDGPNGETFTAASHTHYDANASLTNAVLLALVDDVVEHGHGSMVKLCINRSNETAVRALDDFVAYVDPRLTLNANANEATTRLDISRIDNRAIGIFGAAEVWVKPWVPANYAFCYDAGADEKPLVKRNPSTGMMGLRIAADFDSYPLRAQFMEDEFGIGVWSRTNGAVLRFNNGSYADPF